ncbi:MAG: DNA recombination protein RmuC [Bacteroidia bacterium]
MIVLVLIIGIALGAALVYFLVHKKGEKILTELQSENAFLQTEKTRSETKLEAAQEEVLKKTQEIGALNEKLTKEFENIANKVVNQSSKHMQERHQEQLKALLDPFKEKIEKFEKKVEDTHKESIRENSSLKEQINQLKTLNQHIGEEAKNLTSALKGDKKMQGNWGEQQLERILQAAGLEKETHYRKEVDLISEDNQHQRPDYIIYLPDDKNLVIDSKVSLLAYERFYNEEDEVASRPLAAEHVKNVKDHIQRLSNVKYDQLHGINSPDYVVMYMPIEGALGLAMVEDPSIFEFALKRNIVLVSNNTLLATLKTVSFIWRQELQNRNALEIARQGGALYDKLEGFVKTLQAIGKKMDGAKDDYDKAINQLYEGKGNLIGRAEKLRELGIKTQKKLPENK